MGSWYYNENFISGSCTKPSIEILKEKSVKLRDWFNEPTKAELNC